MGRALIVQIYEIQDPWEAEKCLELGVDHVGSVLLDRDEWKVPVIRQVVEVVQSGGAKSSLIPLFSDFQLIAAALDYYQPDFVHFCEALTTEAGGMIDFSPFLEVQEAVKARFPGLGIIRSIPVPPPARAKRFPTLEVAHQFEELTDIFLIDTALGNEPIDGFIGITGLLPDLDLAQELAKHSSIPVILAGGLSPENVFDALVKVGPSGADSCTRTNRLDCQGNPIRFQKDFEKVKRFVQEVRRAEKVLASVGNLGGS